MSSLLQDVRFAWRLARRLALTHGAFYPRDRAWRATALFSVANAIVTLRAELRHHRRCRSA